MTMLHIQFGQCDDNNAMEFIPASMTIVIEKGWRMGKRQFAALLVHELVHVWEWVVIYRKNTVAWNENPNPELLAERIQYKLLDILHD